MTATAFLVDGLAYALEGIIISGFFVVAGYLAYADQESVDKAVSVKVHMLNSKRLVVRQVLDSSTQVTTHQSAKPTCIAVCVHAL